MSQENVEIIRRLYQAMDAGDLDTLAELAHPDAEWIPDPVRVGEGPIRGVDNVIRFHMDRAEMFKGVRAEFERFADADGKVLVFLRLSGEGAASGARFDIRIAHL